MDQERRPGGWDRRQAACQMLAAGSGCTAIANSLGVTRQTVYRWKRLLDTEGVAAVMAGHPQGRTAQLTSDQVELLRRALQQRPGAFGCGAGPWSLKTVSRFIDEQFGVAYGASNVSRLLLSMGLSVKDLR